MIHKFIVKGLARSFSYDVRGLQISNQTKIEIREPIFIFAYHDTNHRPLGAGKLKRSDRGLEFYGTFQLNDADSYDSTILRNIGDLRGLSIGFTHDAPTERPSSALHVEVREVSLVKQPADPLSHCRIERRAL